MSTTRPIGRTPPALTAFPPHAPDRGKGGLRRVGTDVVTVAQLAERLRCSETDALARLRTARRRREPVTWALLESLA